jgi:hypothetical protein
MNYQAVKDIISSWYELLTIPDTNSAHGDVFVLVVVMLRNLHPTAKESKRL